jgi:hypothetical protein
MVYLIQTADKFLCETKTQPYSGKELPPPEEFSTVAFNSTRTYRLFKYCSSKKEQVVEYHEVKKHSP